MLFISFRPRGIAHDNAVSNTARRLQQWDLQCALRAYHIESSYCVARISDSRVTEVTGGKEEGLSLLWFVPDLGVA